MKGFAAIAKPLTNLTKKDRDFTWNDEEEAAFRKLKEALTSAPILQVFDEDNVRLCVALLLLFRACRSC